MNTKLVSGGSLGAILLTAASAAAQAPPPPPLPSSGDPTTPTGGEYPAELPERPLMLPERQAEIDASIYIPTNDAIDFFDFVGLSVVARYSLGKFEPFAGMDLAVVKPDGVDALQTLVGGARILAGPGDAKGAVYLYGPGSDFSTIEVDGSYEYKQHFNPQLAALGEGGLAFDSSSGGDAVTGSDFSATALYLFARAAVQAKVAPAASVEAGLQVSLPLSSSVTVGGVDQPSDPDTVFALHGMGLYNVGKIDVYGRLDVRFIGDTTTTIATIGILARPL